MSEEVSAEQALNNMKFLTEGDMPQAQWTIGGAFRYDHSLHVIGKFLETGVAVRQFAAVGGSMPCLWSLDHFTQRRPVPMNTYCRELETYAQNNIGVTLVFDNPYLSEAELDDPYGVLLVQELWKRDRVRKNRVAVANDALAAKIRSICPRIPIDAHFNRAIAEKSKRDAAFYNRLTETYARVTLHPADGSKKAVLEQLADPAKFELVMNDPTLRSNPLRREILQAVSDMRRRPYDTELMRRRAELVNRAGDRKIDPAALSQHSACNLTRAEARAAYELGFRSFIVQGALFRNEITLLWDIFQCLFSYEPELFSKHALIASSAMSEFGKPSDALPSGLKQFLFSQYE